jgi:uncharacterized surface protein with fasciclin (FAS1) repeats
MKHGTFSYTALAAAVGLACGAAIAQDRVGEEGVGVEPRIEATDEADLDRPRDSSVDGGALESERQTAQPGSEFESGAIGADPESGSIADDSVDSDADLSTSDVRQSDASQQGNPEQLDGLTEEHDDLGKFVEAVKAAGLANSLTGETRYTVFAPTDEALEAMPEDWLEPANRDQLVSMLRAHIVADDVDQEMARNLQAAQTIDGGTVQISAEGDQLMVGDATVVEPDIQAGNLRIHAIDKVLSENAGNVAVATADPASRSEPSPDAQEDDAGLFDTEDSDEGGILDGGNDPGETETGDDVDLFDRDDSDAAAGSGEVDSRL